MKIGINLLPFRKNLTGTGVYAYNIIEEISHIDSRNEYFLFTNKESSDIFKTIKTNFITITLPFYARDTLVRIFWEQFIFPSYLKKFKIYLLFSPSDVLPILSKCKNVICIHDLIPFHIEKKYTKLRSFYIRVMTRFSAEKADKVLTVSNNSKLELQKYCRISHEKIIVTYNGVNKFILNPDNKKWENFKHDNNIPNKYILYLGTLEPGKNINTLLKAFKILKENNNISQKLVIAGDKGWLFKSIFNEVKNLKLDGQVIFPNYVSNDILGLLYKNTEIFILPSLYEGFGIPALEAMYFGAPVIVSNTSSLPEVVGEAGKLVNPHSEADIAKAIYKVLNNLSLRKNMIEKGYKQAAKFSWEKAAQITLNEILKFK